MPISWNEIRQNAIRFSREWAEEHREDAEAKTFWDEFFAAFGMRRRTIATFEEPVRRLSGSYGFIDLFWRGVLLVEHKSRGGDLDKASSQAFRYLQDLARENRPDDLPRYVILSDFQRIALYDLAPDEQLDLPLLEARHFRKTEFPLAELHKHIQEFAFIAGYKQHRAREADPINIQAVEILGDLHDALAEGGYGGHDLERFLVRVLFCLFADDTGLFEPEAFTLYIENRTARDGSDLGLHLARLFEVLDTPPENRQQKLEELLAAFPYVNGALFAERLAFADFDRLMRDALLACTRFDWSRISPAIFGSLFQDVMDPKERRQTGGHYTSERDILKVINTLFMDDLRAEFSKARRNKAMLKQFHEKLGRLRFLDPACGCGNFLVIAYRELRLLEIAVLKARFGDEVQGNNVQVQTELNVHELSLVDVDAFYGIEIQEWPARIAEVAMWLMDHQMNTRLSETFGQYFVRLPLRKSAHITLGNALRLDWKTLLPPDQCSFVLGNPPFVGKKEQNAQQKADMDLIWKEVKGSGNLDYVTCWYRKATNYIKDAGIRCAFVSTNSITQGEQVGILWTELFNQGHIKIHFAHRTFQWQSEARGKAHVHVVIIGFAAFDTASKFIYEYHDLKGNPTVVSVSNINPYLLAGGDTTVRTRTTPINGAPPISYGSMMIDKDRENGEDSGLILSRESRDALLAECPALKPFIRELCGGEEFLNGTVRWCLWLVDAPPDLLRASPLLRARIETVRAFRAASGRPQTRKLAATPYLFGEIRQPDTRYLLIPKVSSESRRYIPIGFLPPRIIASGSALIVPGASKYDFGILSSGMHNAWMRTVAGRMKSDYQYSNNIVYNNFPWPEHPPAKKKTAIEAKVQAILDARAKYTQSTLADLYDPLCMPADLVRAHAELDRAVDQCYQKQPFTSDRQRVEFLFTLCERYISPLLPTIKPKQRRTVRR
jgi:hypothetical protein